MVVVFMFEDFIFMCLIPYSTDIPVVLGIYKLKSICKIAEGLLGAWLFAAAVRCAAAAAAAKKLPAGRE